MHPNDRITISVVVEILCALFLHTFGIGHITLGVIGHSPQLIVRGVVLMLCWWLLAAFNFALCFVVIGFVTWPLCWVVYAICSCLWLSKTNPDAAQ